MILLWSKALRLLKLAARSTIFFKFLPKKKINKLKSKQQTCFAFKFNKCLSLKKSANYNKNPKKKQKNLVKYHFVFLVKR